MGEVMASDGRFERDRDPARGYRPMVGSPAMLGHPDSAPLALPYAGSVESDRQTTSDDTTRADASDGPRPKKWQRLVRKYRIPEFGCTIVLYIISKMIGNRSVYQRSIPRVQLKFNSTLTLYARDPAIDEEKMTQQVPTWLLVLFCVGVPVIVNLLMNFVLPKLHNVRLVPYDVRDFLLSLGQSLTLSTLLTQFAKNMTGRFRPCFYDMCGWDYDVVWDGVTNLCTDAAGEKEGRKSFPSGHSSFSWSTMIVLTFYLLGRSRLNGLNRNKSVVRSVCETLKLFCCFLPTLASAWISITRSIDNYHHYSDIVAGSIIGVVSGCMGYSYNYGSVFFWESAGMPREVIQERSKAKYQDAMLWSPQVHSVHDRSFDGPRQ